jgi:hypothetical protein
MCGVPSPLVHFEQVDIGVGVQEYDHQWECPQHGVFVVGVETKREAHVFHFQDHGRFERPIGVARPTLWERLGDKA